MGRSRTMPCTSRLPLTEELQRGGPVGTLIQACWSRPERRGASGETQRRPSSPSGAAASMPSTARPRPEPNGPTGAMTGSPLTTGFGVALGSVGGVRVVSVREDRVNENELVKFWVAQAVGGCHERQRHDDQAGEQRQQPAAEPAKIRGKSASHGTAGSLSGV